MMRVCRMSDGVIAEKRFDTPSLFTINHCLKPLFTMKLKKLTIYCLAFFVPLLLFMRNPVKKFKRNVAAIRFFPVGMPTLRG